MIFIVEKGLVYKKCNINVFISCQSLGKLFTSQAFVSSSTIKTGMKTLAYRIVSIKELPYIK